MVLVGWLHLPNMWSCFYFCRCRKYRSSCVQSIIVPLISVPTSYAPVPHLYNSIIVNNIVLALYKASSGYIQRPSISPSIMALVILSFSKISNVVATDIHIQGLA